MPAVYPTMLVDLNSIDVEQANITEATAKAVNQMLNYAAMQSETITRYHASIMILHIHGDASFLSESRANNRAGRYHYLITASADPNKAPLKKPPLNRPVCVKCTTTRNVLSSATGRTWRPFLKLSERHSDTHGAHKNRTHPATHPISDGQLHRRRIS